MRVFAARLIHTTFAAQRTVINTNFAEVKNYFREALDKRQMVGGLTFELIEDQISRPILDELANLKVSLDKRQVPLDDSNEPNAMPSFRWSSDTTPFLAYFQKTIFSQQQSILLQCGNKAIMVLPSKMMVLLLDH